MKVIVSGAGGMIGAALVRHLRGRGHDVHRLVRSTKNAAAGDIAWQPEKQALDAAALAGATAVIHLGGANIATRWTPAAMRRIRASRVDSTRLLVERMTTLPQPPYVFLCASAIGFYGDRGSELLDEGAAPGRGFLVDVCREWEQAAQAAHSAGIRVVNLRFGTVLSPQGGALARMLPVFRRGWGGPLGSGQQWMSWIALDEAVRAIEYCMEQERLAGPVNIVSPHPVPNTVFTSALSHVLHRSTRWPVPAFVLRLIFGRLTDEVLLASIRANPTKLLRSNFVFRDDNVQDTLRRMLRHRAVGDRKSEDGTSIARAGNMF